MIYVTSETEPLIRTLDEMWVSMKQVTNEGAEQIIEMKDIYCKNLSKIRSTESFITSGSLWLNICFIEMISMSVSSDPVDNKSGKEIRF